jgi:ankyrin repeat protein
MAVYVNNLVIAHMLVSQGADVNAADIAGVSPLVTAAWVEESDAMVALLLDMNADVNHVAANGVSPLFHAVSNDNATMVSMLLCHGANINRPLPDGTTPLHSAVFLQNSEIVDLLLQFRANVDPMVDGTTPIQTAVRMPSLDIVERLLAHGTEGALHIAAECGACPCVKLLLRYGAQVNAVDQHGVPPIKYAIENEHVPVTILLLSAGASFSINQIRDLAPYQEWASGHTSDLKGLALVSTFPVASRVVDCNDLKEVILHFLVPSAPIVTALAWRVLESTA